MLLLSATCLRLLYILIYSAPSLINRVALVFQIWEAVYVIYLLVAFFLIGFLRLPGCEFTAANHVVRGNHTHRCVDSVLNSVLDEMQDRKGLCTDLLKTESANKWILGAILLFGFLAVLGSGLITHEMSSISIGVFALVYYAYDKTIHHWSIGRRDLTGSGDYIRIIVGYICKGKQPGKGVA